MSAMVEFRNVSYRIGAKQILSHLHLSVEAGETLVVLGRSGSGKTTALKMVNGLILPTEGEVRVEGKPTTAWDLVRLRRRIGYVIQDVGLFPHFTVAQNIGLVPRLEAWEPQAIGQRVAELLAMLDLPPQQFLHRYPRELSGGQRQRIGVARALAANQQVLLFDEPFGALDPVTRHEIQQQFLRLSRALGKTSIFVTHDPREAMLIATRIALLREGRLEVLDTPADFLAARGEEAQAFRACLG
jgi:osmoprotectant transport system ATP-binding protein